MQDWKIKRLEQLAKPEEERVLPPFSPPKPKLADGLLCLFDVFNTDMKAEKYQEGMARCFVKSGQFPDENGTTRTSTVGCISRKTLGHQSLTTVRHALCQSLWRSWKSYPGPRFENPPARMTSVMRARMMRSWRSMRTLHSLFR